MSNIIDARGRSCPEPVLMAKKACDQSKEVKVYVDNKTAVQNLKRLANKLQRDFSVVEENDDFIISLVK